jgi:chromate transporter
MSSLSQIAIRFLWLGCIAFGGPMAHLAWFERVFVGRLKWLTHEELAGLIALCQALPGPASSQAAMGIGYLRGGWKGLLVAWTAFTLPSAILMLLAAYGALSLPESIRDSLVHGMKVAVVSVIAVALWKMGTSLIRTQFQVIATLLSAAFFLLFMGPWTILLSILLVVLVSLKQSAPEFLSEFSISRLSPGSRLALWALPAFWLIFQLANSVAPGSWTAIPAAFYQTGLLVFGGGHVVLPLLENLVVAPGWVSQESFLLGYGFTQMVPGPIFSFSAFLGASFPMDGTGRLAGGLLALACIYLPSFFLLGVLLPHWKSGQTSPKWQAVLGNLHPLVVGLLLATWISPVLTSAISGWPDVLIAAGLAVLIARFPKLTLPGLVGTVGIYLLFIP